MRLMKKIRGSGKEFLPLFRKGRNEELVNLFVKAKNVLNGRTR
jgi:hypothetical protein